MPLLDRIERVVWRYVIPFSLQAYMYSRQETLEYGVPKLVLTTQLTRVRGVNSSVVVGATDK